MQAFFFRPNRREFVKAGAPTENAVAGAAQNDDAAVGMGSFVGNGLCQSGEHAARQRVALWVLELNVGNAVGARYLDAAF